MKIEDKVWELIKETVENLQIEIYDIEYVKEGNGWFLRIYIDKENGVDINDCENVSRAVEPVIDEAEILTGQYCLEVSSPGIERVLRRKEHFEKYINSEVEISLYKSVDNSRSFKGILKEADETKIVIDDKVFERKDVSKVKTVYEF